MRKLLAMICMMFGSVCAVNASGTAKTSGKKATKLDKKIALVAEKRADHLSDVMIRDLALNNYQSRKMREINQDVVAQKMAIEAEFAGNQELINQKCKEVCAERDRQLENVLSTRQYNEYFGDRKVYDQTEQEFMATLSDQNESNQIASSDVASATNAVSIK
ncbi:hypothetical protein ACSX1A_09585 [Pontibacter sp. MBLB2868]|uniref:hypothetical protein n=1 Tax=Pontibacter sp. MBLB2868 TaxID=3451555 RepID=UPI003F74DEFF